jgi:hypothetical protein
MSEMGLGCVKTRRSYSSKTVLVAQRASGFNLEIERKNIILRRVSIFEFLHSQGQKSRFGDVRVSSALPLKADIHRNSRHVSIVQSAEVAPRRRSGPASRSPCQFVLQAHGSIRRYDTFLLVEKGQSTSHKVLDILPRSGIASWHDCGGLDHQDHTPFGRARAMQHSLRHSETLIG